MTILAWDGKTLAADKLADCQGLKRSITKIWKLEDGRLFGGVGNAAQVAEMRAWIESGADKQTFPDLQKDRDEWGSCIIIDSNGVHVYERTPYPIRFGGEIFASGSGRDFAITAMYLGKTAKEAVEIASLFETGCGMGVDELTL